MENCAKKNKYSNNQKIIIATIIMLSMLILLVGCSGSKTYQGIWHVQNSEGQNSTINFRDKKLSIDGDEYEYTQDAVGFENGIKYYGIVQNGKHYSIIFPEKDKNISLMIEPDSTDNYLQGTLIFAMNKNETPNYNSYIKKYIN